MASPRQRRLSQEPQVVRPDSKGRVTLGRAAGISGYRMTRRPSGQIILDPLVEIPAAEKWLWENKAAMESVQRGLEQSARGETVSRRSFAEYAEDEDE